MKSPNHAKIKLRIKTTNFAMTNRELHLISVWISVRHMIVTFNAQKHSKNSLNDVLVHHNVLVSYFYIRYMFFRLHENLFSADCPCESYDCGAIENSETSVLILYSNTNFAFDQHVLDRDGSKYEILSDKDAFFIIIFIELYTIISGSRVLDAFNYERDTQVVFSCSVVMGGKMWVFGGDGSFKRQLSSVAQCHLKTEGKMPFDLDRGAANTVEGFNSVQTTILCFDNSKPYKTCHS